MYSFCISMKEPSWNKVFATAYSNDAIKQKLVGDEEIIIGDQTVDVKWSVSGTPKVSFSNIPDGRQALDTNGAPLVFTADMFTIPLPVSFNVDSAESNLPLELVANAYLEDNAVSFKVVGLMVDDPSYSALDLNILKGICPKLIKSINSVLGFKDKSSKPYIFNLEFLNSIGIRTEYLGLQKYNDGINIWGNSDNVIPYLNVTTDNDYSVIISNDLLINVLNKNYKAHMSECKKTQDFDETYKVGILGHFGVKCTISVDAKDIKCISVKDNDIEMELSPKLNCNGKAKLFGADVGTFGYDYQFNPDPIPCKAKIDFRENKIHSELCDFKSFGVLLTPIGNAISKMESGVLWPFTEAVTNFVTGIIPEVITIPFDIVIPLINIQVLDTVNIQINSMNLGKLFVGESMMVEGLVEVTTG